MRPACAARRRRRWTFAVAAVAFAIEVEATEGIVSLSGTVPDQTRRELAREVAGATRGVAELHDLLRLQ